MTSKLLTIAVPTYNRAAYLRMLLETLSTEVRGLEESIDIVVSDNASTDETPEVVAEFLAACSVGRMVRQARNIGSAPNFVECYEAARSRYFWMFGDDDVPAAGLLRQVVELLAGDAPDLVYVDSKWAANITPLAADKNVPALRVRRMTREAFCRRTNVYLTFISSIIVSKDCLAGNLDLCHSQRQLGAYFVQLAWTLGAVRHGKRFTVIEGPCVLATKGNSSGYALMTVFGVEFPKVVQEVLGSSREASIIWRRTLVCYLPGLFWEARNGTAGRFDAESPWTKLRCQLGGFAWYWAVLVPIGLAWRPLAQGVRLFARTVSYAVRWSDRRATA